MFEGPCSSLPLEFRWDHRLPARLGALCVFMETFCLFPEMGICQTLNECRQSWQGGVTAQETDTQS